MNIILRQILKFGLERAAKKSVYKHPQVVCFAHDSISRKIMIDGLFEKKELFALKSFLLSEPYGRETCLDIGGNIGNHALFFADLFDQVVSFEPNPKIFNALKNIISNSGEIDKNKTLAYFCGDHISSDLDLELKKEGFRVDKIINYTSEKIVDLNEENNKIILNHPPDIILVYSKRSAESFVELAKKYSLNALMTGSRVMCISEKVLNVFKQTGWKKLEVFEPGEELLKIGN